MVKIEPSEPIQPPTIEEFIENILGYPEYFYVPDNATLLQFFENFESYKLWQLSGAQNERIVQGYVIEENFVGDWRKGKEIHKVVITQRLYQTSPTSTQV